MPYVITAAPAVSEPVDRCVVSPVAETVNVTVWDVPTSPACATGVKTSAASAELAKAAETVGDPLWRMPLWAGYEPSLDSDIADLKNDSDGWAQAGSVTAALFLQRFAPTSPWVHLDIFAWNPRGQAGFPAGAEAQAIRALFEVLKGRYA